MVLRGLSVLGIGIGLFWYIELLIMPFIVLFLALFQHIEVLYTYWDATRKVLKNQKLELNKCSQQAS